MDEETARYLTGEAGRELLEAAAALSGDKAARVLALRKRRGLDPGAATGAVEITVARERARRRGIPDADRLFVTEDALAQATSPVLSAYHARYLAPFGTVADLCCGIGMDALALAQAGAAHVIAVDVDPVRLAFAEANARVCGLADRMTFRCEPVEALGWLSADAAFFDPARRTDAGRVSRHGDRYAPPLDFLQTIRARVRGGAAKLSPALPDDVLGELGAARIEFLSEDRECKEACVWFGEATGASGAGDDLTAVLLPEGGFLTAGTQKTQRGEGGEEAFLLDPDPAIIRAGAVERWCEETGAWRVSEEDAYLFAEKACAWGALSYRVAAVMTYSPKTVGAWLRENGVRRLTVKKRHYGQEPDVVARELGMSVRGEGREMTLVLVRQFGKRFTAVLCEPV